MFPIRDHNPSGRTPYVTYALLAANIAIFLIYWSAIPDDRALFRFYQVWGMVPSTVISGESPHTVFTSMFLHAGWLHLAGNMLFLWIFGDNIEDEMGHIPFLMFYLACGLGAALIHVLAGPDSRVPTVGASGAIAGVMGGYLLLFPKARVDIFVFFIIFFRIFPVPAWITLVAWLALQVFGGFSSPSTDGGGVAYWAHIGGFGVGMLLTLPLFLRLGGTAFWSQTLGAPPHPEAKYKYVRTAVPRVTRR